MMIGGRSDSAAAAPPQGGHGRPAASDLLPTIYGELRDLAAGYLKRERVNHTLQPTALVHEAYSRLAGLDGYEWRNRDQFLAMAANVMRRVLVDHARRHRAVKRGHGLQRTPLSVLVDGPSVDPVELLALDEALGVLATLNSRQAQIVELRYFGGLSVEDTARVLEVSSRTVEVDWHMARAWLRRTVGPDQS